MAGGATPLPPARDITPPVLRTRIPARQRVLRLGGVVGYARCREACTVAASARVLVGRRTYALAKTHRRARSGHRVRVRVKLTRRARRALRTSLRRGGHPQVRLGLRARDTSGNRSKLVRRRVAVRR